MDPKNIFHHLYDFLINQGVPQETAVYLNIAIGGIFVAIISFLLDYVARRLLVALAHRIAPRTNNYFDDYLIKNKTPQYLAHLVPIFFIAWVVPYLLESFPDVESIIHMGIDVYMIILIILVIRSVLRSFRDYLKTLRSFKDKPIHSYIQVFMSLVCLALFLVFFCFPFLGIASSVFLIHLRFFHFYLSIPSNH